MIALLDVGAALGLGLELQLRLFDDGHHVRRCLQDGQIALGHRVGGASYRLGRVLAQQICEQLERLRVTALGLGEERVDRSLQISHGVRNTVLVNDELFERDLLYRVQEVRLLLFLAARVPGLPLFPFRVLWRLAIPHVVAARFLRFLGHQVPPKSRSLQIHWPSEVLHLRGGGIWIAAPGAGGFERVEALPGISMHGLPTSHRLPAPDREIDVHGVGLDTDAASPGPLGGKQRRARAQERIEDQVPGRRHVQKRIHHHADRLDRRVCAKVVIRIGSPARSPCVVPDIGAIATVPTELHVVLMRPARHPGNEHMFVLTPVQAPHSRVGLHPDTDVQKIKPERVQCLAHLPHVAPVHADKDDAAWPEACSNRTEGLRQEPRELRWAHLSGGLRELPVAALFGPDMSVDLHVVGWVCEAGRSSLSVQYGTDAFGVPGRTAEETMLAEDPEVAGLTDCAALPGHRGEIVRRVRLLSILLTEADRLDLGHPEAGDLEITGDFDQLADLEPHRICIPGTGLLELVQRKRQTADLHVRKIVDDDALYRLGAETLRGLQTYMAVYHLMALAIGGGAHQDGNPETVGFDGSSDVRDLFLKSSSDPARGRIDQMHRNPDQGDLPKEIVLAA